MCLPYVDIFKKILFKKDFPEVENASDYGSYIWLAMYLAEATWEDFQILGYKILWEEKGYEISEPRKKKHKEEDYGVGVDACYV